MAKNKTVQFFCLTVKFAMISMGIGRLAGKCVITKPLRVESLLEIFSFYQSIYFFVLAIAVLLFNSFIIHSFIYLNHATYCMTYFRAPISSIVSGV